MNRRLATFWVLAAVLAALLVVALYCSPAYNEPAVTPKSTEAPRPTTTVGREYAYAGLPKGTAQVLVLRNKGYVVGYSEDRKDPLWACYRVFHVTETQTPPRPSRFTTDLRTTAKVSSDDYTRTGYDRGHMAPNYAIALCYGREAQLGTFLMSNVIPQKPELNRQIWQRLEMLIAKDYAQELGDVWVITGPVFGADTRKLPGGVAIPDACYDVVLDEVQGTPRVLAFVIPQDVPSGAKLEDYLRSVDDVEALTGLDFLSDLPDDLENRLEADKPTTLWP